MASVDVSVEVLNECQIQEIGLDGHEVYVQPLSMSENLTKLAHKIDFSKDESEEKGKPTSEGDKDEEEESTSTAIQPELWPWDSVWNKLKSAATEIGVLQDVLAIAREKRYLVLDPVRNDTADQRPIMHMLARKKALYAAGNILSTGYERLRKCQDAVSATRHTSADFNHELLRLRQQWRLKKVGSTIIGDLSYKSAGSRYWQSGSFEVSKADNEVESADGGNLSPHSAIRVTVLTELEGVAYIQVAIRELSSTSNANTSELDLATADVNLCHSLAASNVPADAPWPRKLEAAQNVIFCKEVFAQLAHEAVQSQASIPHVVIGNQILSHLFPGVQLSISLRHYTDQRKPQFADHNHVLEHSLHQLLREMHHRNSNQSLPHPATAVLGVSKRRRLAGPMGYSREAVNEPPRESMLTQIVNQARHIVVRKRMMTVIDELAHDISDPQIVAHVSNISLAVESVVRICITFIGYDTPKTMLILHIGCDGAKAICKDGRVIELSYDVEQLRDLIRSQVAQHYATCIQTFCKPFGWQVVALNSHLGVGDLEPFGNAVGAIIASPFHDKVVCIRSGPSSGVHIYVQCLSSQSDSVADRRASRSSISHLLSPSLVKLSSDIFATGPWLEVAVSRTDGRTFTHKLEAILACLMPDRTVDR